MHIELEVGAVVVAQDATRVQDWHQRLGSGVHADTIMDRIMHNTIWIETGHTNMREHTASRH